MGLRRERIQTKRIRLLPQEVSVPACVADLLAESVQDHVVRLGARRPSEIGDGTERYEVEVPIRLEVVDDE